MTRIVTAEEHEAYERDGFVVIEGLVTEAELDRFEPLVTEAVRVRSDPDSRALPERSLYEQSFQQCINLWEDFPALRPLVFHPRVGQAAAELLGVEVVRLWHDQALYKRAGGRDTDAHQDQPYWPIAETDTITAWIPLQGSTIESGAMAYLPGSHRTGLRKFQNIFTADDVKEFLASPEIAEIDPVWVEVPRGGVAFHSGLTVHMAKPNVTGTDRAVQTMIMFADGCTRSTSRFHPSVDRDAIAVGAPIRGACTPILWPLEPGDYPAPPPPVPDALHQVAAPGIFPRAATTN